MRVNPGDTDVTTYVNLRDTADGTAKTGLDVTTLDLQYVRSGAAPVAKVDATALAATDSVHADNKAIEIDATDQPGLYRVDWPDAAFASGVREVVLTVKCAGAFAEHIRVELDGSFDAAQAAADAALVANYLDHLCKTATVAADMTAEVADNTILSRLLASGDTSAFDPTTDSLQDVRDKQTDIETDTQDIQSRIPATLSGDNIKADTLAISTSATAADKLEASAETIESAAAAAGTLSTTQMTTNLTEATGDHYNGRIIIWTSGVLLRQATDITDYAGGTKMLTFTAVTEAPGDGDTFVIV